MKISPVAPVIASQRTQKYNQDERRSLEQRINRKQITAYKRTKQQHRFNDYSVDLFA